MTIKHEEKKTHGRYVRIKNAENIYFCTQTSMFYLVEQTNRRRTFRSTGIKGEIKLEENEGKFLGQAIKGLGAAKNAIKELRLSKGVGFKLGRPTYIYFSEVTLEIQKTKSHRTWVIAKDGDKNLRPFFELNCPYLDLFEENYEQFWARYQAYQAQLNPGRKLSHDRKYLIMVLRRAKKQKAISNDFVKGDFPLSELIEPIGRALEDFEVKFLLQAAHEMGNIKMFRQIKLAVHLGLRKMEIMQLSTDEVNLDTREIDLDPKRLKTRRPRIVPIPIHDDVYYILRSLVNEAEGKYLFPKQYKNIKGSYFDHNKHQVDFANTFGRVRRKAKVKCRFHDLRHTCITNMVADNIPISTISKIMGASIDLINKIYDHLNKKTKNDLKNLSKGRFDIELD